eukprot:TRINITY_DN290_c0_g1_i4.p1 TRINITY_DN290_c0_g1~~TRINITY_DN290_c0_g1_i4.p1  ORF type:complete len:270 (+),score=31.34 TRINITY_DN290_c0_g1_i4:39-812(+)
MKGRVSYFAGAPPQLKHTKRSRDVPDEEVTPPSKIQLQKAIHSARCNAQPCRQGSVVPLDFLVKSTLLPKYRELFPDEKLEYDGKQLLLRLPGTGTGVEDPLSAAEAAASNAYRVFSEIDNPHAHRSKRAAVRDSAALEETLGRKSMAYALLQSGLSLQFPRVFLSQLEAGLLQAIQNPDDEVFAGVIPASKRDAELLCELIDEVVSQVASGRKIRFWFDSDTGDLFLRVLIAVHENATKALCNLLTRNYLELKALG